MNKIIGAEKYPEIDQYKEKVVAKILGHAFNKDIQLKDVTDILNSRLAVQFKVYLINTKTGEEKLVKEINSDISALNITQDILLISKYLVVCSMHEREYNTFVFQNGQLMLEKDIK